MLVQHHHDTLEYLMLGEPCFLCVGTLRAIVIFAIILLFLRNASGIGLKGIDCWRKN